MFIFAAVTNKESSGNAPQLVLQGLSAGEFRGYDSWGIAYQEPDGGYRVHREVGHVNPGLILPRSDRAIGHLRWATHGGVTEANAHPHTGCSTTEAGNALLVVAHNGIIENHKELREKTPGHHYKSQTDSEVFVHLLENERTGLPHAMLRVFPRLELYNAVVAAHRSTLAVVRYGSPLALGDFPGGYLVSSDPAAFKEYTNRVFFVENDDVAVIEDEVRIWSPNAPYTRPARFEDIELS